ncbi:hypothetical protein [Chryseobacterium arachidis]|uniref:hypothetical protein n=1 Tax=Chryseobacterium arachidis TaxID=1416778 RepID=UPI001160C395|nr:hypothetical protein [Chryseobacterium arachidis]
MKSLFLILLMILASELVFAQNILGRITDQLRGQSFALYDNGLVVQDGNPTNRGFAQRDPSGLMFLRLPAVDPAKNAYFLDYRGNFIEIDYRFGSRVIGNYDFKPPSPIEVNTVSEESNPNVGIVTATGAVTPVPVILINKEKPYGNVMITSELAANNCYKQSLMSSSQIDKQKFGHCMIEKMSGKKEFEIYKCSKNSVTPEEETLCMINIMGRSKEQQYSRKIAKCHNEFGSDYSKFPLCFSETEHDSDFKKMISCVKGLGQQGLLNFSNVAICYGANAFDITPESLIVAQCSSASVGDPYVFVGCAGGKLSSAELNKCLTQGVGGDKGCFGKNNAVHKTLISLGDGLNKKFGAANSLVKDYNKALADLNSESVYNTEAVRILRDTGNELKKQQNDSGQEQIKKLLPYIKW